MTEPHRTGSILSPAPYLDDKRTSWVRASIAGLVVGLVAAALYALISASMKAEILYLIIGVGAVVGLAVVFVAKVDNAVTGFISLGIGAVSIAVAIYLYIASLGWGSLPEALSHISDTDTAKVFELYFEDPLGYLWVAAGLVAAYYFGSGLFTQRKNKAEVKAQAEAVDDKLEAMHNPPRA